MRLRQRRTVWRQRRWAVSAHGARGRHRRPSPSPLPSQPTCGTDVPSPHRTSRAAPRILFQRQVASGCACANIRPQGPSRGRGQEASEQMRAGGALGKPVHGRRPCRPAACVVLTFKACSSVKQDARSVSCRLSGQRSRHSLETFRFGKNSSVGRRVALGTGECDGTRCTALLRPRNLTPFGNPMSSLRIMATPEVVDVEDEDKLS